MAEERGEDTSEMKGQRLKVKAITRHSSLVARHSSLVTAERRAAPLRSGQAMIEFVIALFAVVVLVAGITEYIGLAAKHGELFAKVRGQAGKQSIENGVDDVGAPDLTQPPAVETSDGVLARGFSHDKREARVGLSKALREWLFDGKLDEITVRGEVWMPGMKVEGVGE